MFKILKYILETILINNRLLSDIHYNLHKKLENPIDPRNGKHREEGYYLMMEIKEQIEKSD